MDQSTYDAHVQKVSPFIALPERSNGEHLAQLEVVEERIADRYKPVSAAFRHNLKTAHAGVTMPFAFALASVRQNTLQRIAIAERIKAQKRLDLSDTEKEQLAHKRAWERFNEETKSDDGADQQTVNLVKFLSRMLSDEGVQETAAQLLEQGIVSTWSAFEVLCRDFFECHLNLNPSLALVLDRPARKRFDLERISLETLSNHGFDLSGAMGSMMVRQHDFSDLGMVKTLYDAIFPDSDALQTLLKGSGLRLLYKRRNLFVHRRGVVDRRYVDETGDAATVGSRLVVRPSDVHEAANMVANAGLKILEQAPQSCGS